MFKLLILSTSLLFSVGLLAQIQKYSGSDDHLKYEVSIQKVSDKQNDVFYEYYALEVTNTTNNEITFMPVFNYKTDKGSQKNTASRDGNQTITLSPGETIKGNQKEHRNLSLFKQFLIGNSGKRASETVYTLESVSFKY